MTATIEPDLTTDIIEHVLATRAATGRTPGSRAIAEHFNITRHKVRSLDIPAALRASETARPGGRGRARPPRRLVPSAPRARRHPRPATVDVTAQARPTTGVSRLRGTGSVSRPPGDPAPPTTIAASPAVARTRSVPRWPLMLMGAPAFVAIWGGWVELGRKAGFGPVQLLPGLADLTVDLAITLPIGLEVYAAYALMIWLGNHATTHTARRFAAISALASLLIGSAGQIAYHLLDAAGIDTAPWQITAAVAVLPVAVVGMGATLAHLINTPPASAPAPPATSAPVS